MTNSPQELEEGHKFEEEIEVIAATMTSHSLVFLDKYTEYRIQILAFNPAGDGPRSRPITVKTLQGLPGPPVNLRFSEITMNSLVVSWDSPKKRNGDIIGYIVTYETTEENERTTPTIDSTNFTVSVGFSKQVKQKVTTTDLQLQSLEEEITYTFTVRAQTIDYGPSISNNVTTGPQEGSPSTPKELTLIKTLSSVELHWVNGLTGKGPILGYYIESRKKGLFPTHIDNLNRCKTYFYFRRHALADRYKINKWAIARVYSFLPKPAPIDLILLQGYSL